MHAQAKHARVVASFRDEMKRLGSRVASLQAEEQSLRAENHKLHSNLATTQLQLRLYQQQVGQGWLRIINAHTQMLVL